MSTQPITGRHGRPSDSDTLARLNRIVTFGRLVWIGLVAERMSGVEGSLTTIKETLRRRQ